MPTTLSVNLNKIALLRNSRGDNYPSLESAIELVIAAGCKSITLHPRADERHAKLSDIALLKEHPLIQNHNVEINIEGDLRKALIDAITAHKVTQFTIVPVKQGEVTTTRGWQPHDDTDLLYATIAKMRNNHIRTSLFIDPMIASVEHAAKIGVDAVEFHTKYYASAYGGKQQREETERLLAAVLRARQLNLRVHLGHDLSLTNLDEIISLTKPDEVSIGHALTIEALYTGLPSVLAKYLQLLSS